MCINMNINIHCICMSIIHTHYFHLNYRTDLFLQLVYEQESHFFQQQVSYEMLFAFLLDGSISLSPLYSDLKIDLHVRTPTSLHHGFPWLHPTHAKFTIFRVPTCMLTLRPFSRRIVAGGQCPKRVLPLLLSLRVGVCHSITRTYVRLLGPCFKTG